MMAISLSALNKGSSILILVQYRIRKVRSRRIISVDLNTGSIFKNHDIRKSAIKSFNQDNVRPIIDVENLDSSYAYDYKSFSDEHARALDIQKKMSIKF